jgi:hypothetical protein
MLIQRTIDSGRSIGTLGLALWELKKNDEKLLKQLEKVISPKQYLGLINLLGDTSTLYRIIRYSSSDFADQLCEAFLTLPPEKRNNILQRSKLKDLAYGVCWSPLLPALLLRDAENMLNEIQRAVGQANWCEQYEAYVLLRQVVQRFRLKIKNLVMKSIQEYLAMADENIFLRSSLSEAVAYLHLNCEIHPHQYKTISEKASGLIPPRVSCLNEEKILSTMGQFCLLMADHRADPKTAVKLFEYVSSEAVVPLIRAEAGGSVCLFLWNVYQLWLECCTSPRYGDFHKALHPEIMDAVQELFDNWFDCTDAEVCIGIIALTGFAAYAHLPATLPSRDDISIDIDFIYSLYNQPDFKNLILRFFFIKGVQALFLHVPVPKKHWMELYQNFCEATRYQTKGIKEIRKQLAGNAGPYAPSSKPRWKAGKEIEQNLGELIEKAKRSKNPGKA